MSVDTVLYASLPIFILPHLFERGIRRTSWPLWTALLLGANAAGVLIPFIGAERAWLPLLLLAVVATGVTTVVLRSGAQAFLARTIIFLVNGFLLVIVVGNPAWVSGFGPWVASFFTRLGASNVLAGSLDRTSLHRFMVYAAGICITSFELNNPIALFLKRTRLMPQSTLAAADQPSIAASDEPARGRVIGVMERAIVFVLAVTGNLSSLGLVLAAKAFARFRQLDDRDFAEYVLIGTLVSITGALLVGLAMKALL